jgi:hypothetical protein
MKVMIGEESAKSLVAFFLFFIGMGQKKEGRFLLEVVPTAQP